MDERADVHEREHQFPRRGLANLRRSRFDARRSRRLGCLPKPAVLGKPSNPRPVSVRAAPQRGRPDSDPARLSAFCSAQWTERLPRSVRRKWPGTRGVIGQLVRRCSRCWRSPPGHQGAGSCPPMNCHERDPRVMPPAWLLDIFTAFMLVVAAVNATRLVVARLPAGRLWVVKPTGPRSWLRGSGGADNDTAHLLMGIAMAGMLAASVTTLPRGRTISRRPPSRRHRADGRNGGPHRRCAIQRHEVQHSRIWPCGIRCHVASARAPAGPGSGGSVSDRHGRHHGVHAAHHDLTRWVKPTRSRRIALR